MKHTVASLLASQILATGSAMLPNPTLTPGAIDPGATVETLCVPGVEDIRHHVRGKTRRKLFDAYGLQGQRADDYVVDLLVPASLGGIEARANLWPQSTTAKPWNNEAKAVLAQHLHQRVCRQEMTLAEAQQAVRTDWTAAYLRYVGTPQLDPSAPAGLPATEPPADRP
jgi:hypothetical protein